MARKKTLEQLEEQIQAAEKRLDELRKSKARETEAQRARINRDLLLAIDEWRLSYESPMEWSELPKYFRSEATRNRQEIQNENASVEPDWMQDSGLI